MPPRALKVWVAATARLDQGTSSAFVPRQTFHSAAPIARSLAQLVITDSAAGSLRDRSSTCASSRSPTSQDTSAITPTARAIATPTASPGGTRRYRSKGWARACRPTATMTAPKSISSRSDKRNASSTSMPKNRTSAIGRM